MSLSNLTDYELDTLISKVISTILRDQLFLPIGLDLLNYTIKFESNLPFGAPACVRYDTGEIFVDTESEFFDQFSDRLTEKESQFKTLTMILLHEVLHPMLLHYKRRKQRDCELWNIAGDFVINLLLRNLEAESQQKITSTGGNVKKIVDMDIDLIGQDRILLSETFENKIEEEVYEFLDQNQHFKKSEKFYSLNEFEESMSGGDGDNDEEGEDDSDDSGSSGSGLTQYNNEDDVPDTPIKETTTEFDFEGKKFKHTTVEFPSPDPSQMTKEEREEANKRMKRSQLSNKQLETTLMKGVGSSSLKDFLGRMFNVKINWEKILKDSLLTAVEPSDEETWGNPEVSWLANPWIPYLPSRRDEEVRGVAILSIDESGSMSNDDVRKAVEIVLQSWEHYKGLYVIKHDFDVVWECKYDEKPSAEDIKELSTRQSCGGTSHEKVFNKIIEYLRTDDDAKVSVYLGITDLFSDIETHQHKFPIDIPRIWIVNSEYHSDDLIGRVIRLK